MPRYDETPCRVCGEPDDSNNAEGPCLACQADMMAFASDQLVDMVRDGDLPPQIARVLAARKKTRRNMDRAR